MKNKYLIAAAAAIVIAAAGVVWWQMTPRQPAQPAAQPEAAQQPSTPVSQPSPAGQPAAVNAPEAPAAALLTSVILRNDPKLGDYLADNNGRTLYYFAKDADGKSACVGRCLEIWPSFHLTSATVGAGVDMEDFAVITGTDGNPQTTYYGWPLYYYSGDAAAGDVKGEGFNDLWYVAKPDYSVLLANKDNANYLVDQAGRALYRSSKDEPNASNCTGVCAETWPPFFAVKLVAPSFIDLARFGQFARPDKTAQNSFDRAPLYYYARDAARGDTLGQGVNNAWSTIDPLAAPPR